MTHTICVYEYLNTWCTYYKGEGGLETNTKRCVYTGCCNEGNSCVSL